MRPTRLIQVLLIIFILSLAFFYILPEYKLAVYLIMAFTMNYVIIYGASIIADVDYKRQKPSSKDKGMFQISEHKDKQNLYAEYGEELGRDIYEYVYKPKKFEERKLTEERLKQREEYAKRVALEEKKKFAENMRAHGKKVVYTSDGVPRIPKKEANEIMSNARKEATKKYPPPSLAKKSSEKMPYLKSETPPWRRVLHATVAVSMAMFALALLEIPMQLYIILLFFMNFMIFYLAFNPRFPSPIRKKIEKKVESKKGKEKLYWWIVSWKHSILWKPSMMSVIHILGVWLIVVLTIVAGYDIGQFWDFLGL